MMRFLIRCGTFTKNKVYPTPQQVEAVFKVLGDARMLGTSFDMAAVRRSLASYDTSVGSSLTYPVSQAFVESIFKEDARHVPTINAAGDVMATMAFNKDAKVIAKQFDISGNERFVIMAFDLGTPVDWGFNDNGPLGRRKMDDKVWEYGGFDDKIDGTLEALGKALGIPSSQIMSVSF